MHSEWRQNFLPIHDLDLGKGGGPGGVIGPFAQPTTASTASPLVTTLSPERDLMAGSHEALSLFSSPNDDAEDADHAVPVAAVTSIPDIHAGDDAVGGGGEEETAISSCLHAGRKEIPNLSQRHRQILHRGRW